MPQIAIISIDLESPGDTCITKIHECEDIAQCRREFISELIGEGTMQSEEEFNTWDDVYYKFQDMSKFTLRSSIVIEYHEDKPYATWLNYISDPAQYLIIRQMTGRKTLDPVWMKLMRDLTKGLVTFKKTERQ